MPHRLLLAVALPFGLMTAAPAHAQDLVTRLPGALALGLPPAPAPLLSIRPMPRDPQRQAADHGVSPMDTDLALRPQGWTGPGSRRPAGPLPGFLIGVFR